MVHKPDCYNCIYRCNIPGDAHIQCTNGKATAVGDNIGITRGWFFWPLNYDPVWLISCDGETPKK